MSKESKERNPKPLPQPSHNQGLSRKSLEVEVIQENLSEDELLDFTNAFIDDMRSMPKLEKFNLLSPESAAQAMEMLEEKQRFLEQKMKTALTLKQMLQRRASLKDNFQ